jgi:hypothetical protein
MIKNCSKSKKNKMPTTYIPTTKNNKARYQAWCGNTSHVSVTGFPWGNISFDKVQGIGTLEELTDNSYWSKLGKI